MSNSRIMTGCIALAAASGFIFLAAAPLPALADDDKYEFKSPPSIKGNAMWRVEVATGAMGYCYFDKPEGDPIGRLSCPAPGEGAGPQAEPGPYELEASHYDTELSIFRVNGRTGTMSLCYGTNNSIVCTPAVR
ncbi:MAG: hypothetical protein AB7O70_10300 [Hyphomicrobiales bacterium]